MPHRDARQLHRARELRTDLTAIEQLLWSRLRRRQVASCKFRRQQVLGPYIVDFVCLEEKLVIELDGGQHVEQRSYDERRTRWLEQAGFRVLRFWDHQVFKELDAVLQVIADKLRRPPPGLRPTSPTQRA